MPTYDDHTPASDVFDDAARWYVELDDDVRIYGETPAAAIANAEATGRWTPMTAPPFVRMRRDSREGLPGQIRTVVAEGDLLPCLGRSSAADVVASQRHLVTGDYWRVTFPDGSTRAVDVTDADPVWTVPS